MFFFCEKRTNTHKSYLDSFSYIMRLQGKYVLLIFLHINICKLFKDSFSVPKAMIGFFENSSLFENISIIFILWNDH